MWNYCNLGRLPSRIENDRREKWIEAVSEHRHNFNPEINSFYICFKHFSESMMERKDANKLVLKKDAVPNVFDGYEVDLLTWTGEMENSFQSEATELTELEKLKQKLQQAEADHDIQMQKMKLQQTALKEKNTKLHIELKEVTAEKQTIEDMLEKFQKKFEGCTPQVII